VNGRRTRRTALVATLATGLLTLAGCQGLDGLYGVSLPGGADLGDHPYTVHAEFLDVLDLVPQSAVKVNDVPVGRVDSITLNRKNWTADVAMTVNGDVRLPGNATADLRQTSLLGEKYVELVAPASNAVGTLANATIPLSRTNRNSEVEQVLGALSMLLNGGGIQQIQTITKELNSATTGNEPEIRALLSNVNTLMSDLDAHSADITNALDGLNRLSATLAAQQDQIAGALDNLAPGLDVLNAQRTQLVTMLQSLSALSGVAVDTINKSQADLVADLKALSPTLDQLAKSGSDLPNALQLLLTFPFSDGAANGIRGDYENLYATLDLNLGNILGNLSRSRQNVLSGVIPQLPGATGGSTGPNPNPTLPLGATSSSGSATGLGGVLSGLLGGL
jgi:phospholipid/cholesterol/gamma-HCH transport system substrate-binding protein